LSCGFGLGSSSILGIFAWSLFFRLRFSFDFFHSRLTPKYLRVFSVFTDSSFPKSEPNFEPDRVDIREDSLVAVQEFEYMNPSAGLVFAGALGAGFSARNQPSL
jgi:hypothetical protein